MWSGGVTSALTLDWNEMGAPFLLPGLSGQELTFWGMWQQKTARARSDKSAKWFSRHASSNHPLLWILPQPHCHASVGARLLTASLLHSAVTVETVVLSSVHTHNYMYTLFNKGLHRPILLHRLLALHLNLLWYTKLVDLTSVCQGTRYQTKVVAEQSL